MSGVSSGWKMSATMGVYSAASENEWFISFCTAPRRSARAFLAPLIDRDCDSSSHENKREKWSE